MSETNSTETRTFRTLEEAQQHERHGKTKKGEVNEWEMFRITVTRPIEPGDYFVWSGTGGVALTQAMQDNGVEVGLATSKRSRPVDPKAILDAMTPEARAALLAAYIPQAQPTEEPTTKRGKKS